MWGAELWDGFGMTEAGMMGGESEAHDGFHIWTDLFDIEVIDLETGEPVKRRGRRSCCHAAVHQQCYTIYPLELWRHCCL